jgi:hypothetical protein
LRVGVANMLRAEGDDQRRLRLLDSRYTTWSRPEGRDHEDAQANQQR